MFQRIVYTILVDRGGHITSCTHHVFGRISHSNPNPDMAKHLNIITTITKGPYIRPDRYGNVPAFCQSRPVYCFQAVRYL